MDKRADAMAHLGAKDVTVGGEIGRRIDITVRNHLLKIDYEGDFLKAFRERKSPVSAYFGIGKLLDSLVRFAAYTGDAEVMRWKNTIARELIESQEEDGYIGAYPKEIRMWYVWDVHEMSYIVYGLVSDYRFFGEERSLHSAKKLMDFMVTRWREQPNATIKGEDLSPWLSTAGFDQALMAVYGATKDNDYLDFATTQRELPTWDMPIVVGRHGNIEGHVYLYLSRALAQHELYRLVGQEAHGGSKQPAGGKPLLDEKAIFAMTRRIMDFITHNNAMVVSGACGQHECWHVDQDGGKGLGETCASAHLTWFMDSLLRMWGDPLYGDFMERIIYNTLFAAQSPEGRRLRYYTPTEGERKYFNRDTYCCPGNFRRIISDLPRMVYYLTDKGVAINLYTESSAKIVLKDGREIRLTQETDYPNSGRVGITVGLSRPAEFPLLLRIPRWCRGAGITGNGDGKPRTENGGRFAVVERSWKDGDRIQLDMPMEWRFIRGRERQSGRAAVMRGPVLFGCDPASNGIDDPESLNELSIDPSSVTGPIVSDRIRPGGLSCRISLARERSPATDAGRPLPSAVTLAEFIDPESRLTYFRVPDSSSRLLSEDELFL